MHLLSIQADITSGREIKIVCTLSSAMKCKGVSLTSDSELAPENYIVEITLNRLKSQHGDFNVDVLHSSSCFEESVNKKKKSMAKGGRRES